MKRVLLTAVLLNVATLATLPAGAQPTPTAPGPTAASSPAPAPTPGPTTPAPTPGPTAPAPAPAPAPDAVSVHGYIQPQFGWKHRPSALVADRSEYGLLSSRAGLIVAGEPIRGWSYTLHLSLDPKGLSLLTGVDLADTNGDGTAESLSVRRKDVLATFFEEASVQYRPIEYVAFKVGAFRLPFSLAVGRSNASLMFPDRAGTSELFISGADRGGMLYGTVLDDRITASAGLFNGNSLGLVISDVQSRGLVYVARIDAAPLGKMPGSEYDFAHGPIRFSLGGGALYRNATLYTQSGYELFEQKDTRVSASVRASLFGAYVQAEVLRRLASDAVSSRPSRATGAYAQASYFIALPQHLGLAPIARVGSTQVEELSKPYGLLSYDFGVAFFPKTDIEKPDTVRVIAQYTGERRTPEKETAQAVLGQLQILF